MSQIKLRHLTAVEWSEGPGAELCGTLVDGGHDLGESLHSGPVVARRAYLILVEGHQHPVIVHPSETLQRQLDHARLIPGDKLMILCHGVEGRAVLVTRYLADRTPQQWAALIHHLASEPGRLGAVEADGSVRPIGGGR